MTSGKFENRALQEKRHDPLRERYEQADRIEYYSRFLDSLALLSFATYAGLHAIHDPRESLAKGAFIALAVLAIALRLYFETWLQYEVDRARRLSLISDSLGVRLTHLIQRDFWTSKHRPSFVRLIHSLAENSFFYPRLLRTQQRYQITFVAISVVLLVVSLRVGTLEFIELFALLIVFGDGGVNRLIRLLWGIRAYERLCNDCLTTLQRQSSGEEAADLSQAMAVAYLAEYEVIKARCRIRVSARIFDRFNPDITREWEEYLSKLETVEPLTESSTQTDKR